VDKIVPRQASLPLKRGSWLHELLEAKYNIGDWGKKNDELAEDFYKLFEEERDAFGDLPTICAHIMRSYDYHWREEDKHLEVIEVEKEFEVPLPHDHVMVFKIDAIVQDEWGMWLMEHKSHKSFPRGDYRLIDMQTPKYVWGLRKLGYPINGTLWNYLSTVEPKRPELLKDGTRLSARKIRTDAITFLETIREYGLDPGDYKDVMIRLRDHADFFRRERVSTPDIVTNRLVKEAVYVADEIERGYQAVRSIDRSCEMFCPYLDPCITSLHGGDISSIVKAKFQIATKRDYYAYAEKETN
jgi:hypothetical protein